MVCFVCIVLSPAATHPHLRQMRHESTKESRTLTSFSPTLAPVVSWQPLLATHMASVFEGTCARHALSPSSTSRHTVVTCSYRYTDPMHPGGKRTITLQNSELGGSQLAKVVGGGGQGEPASYELPATISRAADLEAAFEIIVAGSSATISKPAGEQARSKVKRKRPSILVPQLGS